MASYLTPYLEPKTLQDTIDIAKAKILKDSPDFDTIAVTGVSGILVGAPLSLVLNKKLIVIRKDVLNGTTHSSERVEGWGVKQRILLVDDIVCSGDTVNRMEEEISAHCDSPTIVGTYLYSTNHFIPKRESSLVSLGKAVRRAVWY